MATYRITAPDGASYEITAPDDATQDQVMAYAQANYAQAGQPKQQQSSQQPGPLSQMIMGQRPTPQRSALENIGRLFVESDRYYPGHQTPQDIEVPTLSPVECRGVGTWSTMGYYSVESGANVFATGTMNWTRSLSGPAAKKGITGLPQNSVSESFDLTGLSRT